MPEILKLLRKYSDFSVTPVPYDVSSQPEITNEIFETFFLSFSNILREHKKTVSKWAKLHSAAWLADNRSRRVPKTYLFSLDKVGKEKSDELYNLARELSLTTEEISYVFDVIFRAPFYGKVVTTENRYLSHPIRDLYLFRGVEYHRSRLGDGKIIVTTSQGIKKSELPEERKMQTNVEGNIVSISEVPLSFEDWAFKRAKQLSMPKFVAEIMNIRHAVRNKGIHQTRDVMSIGEIRELAIAANLPATTRGTYLKIGTIAFSVGSAALSFEALKDLSSNLVFAAVVAVPTTIWAGQLSSDLPIRWARWAVSWPELEKFGN